MDINDLTLAYFPIERVFSHANSKNQRPMCLVHQRWLFLVIPGYKSFAFDYITHRHIEFPKLPIIYRNAVVDAKIMVLNERDLVVSHASRVRRSDENTEMLIIDLHQLSSWKRVKLREDMRAANLVNFAIIPFVKEHQVRECLMMIGGT